MLPLPVLLHLALAAAPGGEAGWAAGPPEIATPAAASTGSSAPDLLALAPPPPAIPLHLFAPPRDPGPFGANELAAASIGVLLGDALVLGAGYGTLQMFASGALEPTAAHFRHAAYALGASSLLVPPLTAALLARWAQAEPASGSVSKALLLATLGQAVALGAGYLAAPHIWVVFPVQLVTVALGTTIGLHWGPRPGAVRPAGASPPARP